MSEALRMAVKWEELLQDQGKITVKEKTNIQGNTEKTEQREAIGKLKIDNEQMKRDWESSNKRLMNQVQALSNEVKNGRTNNKDWRNNRQGSNEIHNGDTKRNDIVCTFCNKLGHLEDRCYAKNPESRTTIK